MQIYNITSGKKTILHIHLNKHTVHEVHALDELIQRAEIAKKAVEALKQEILEIRTAEIMRSCKKWGWLPFVKSISHDEAVIEAHKQLISGDDWSNPAVEYGILSGKRAKIVIFIKSLNEIKEAFANFDETSTPDRSISLEIPFKY